MAQRYGAYRESEGVSERALFVVDGKGVISWSYCSPIAVNPGGGDYECPHCGRAHPIVKRVQKHFGRRLRFVFRNFPLTQIHPHAQTAAEAAGRPVGVRGPGHGPGGPSRPRMRLSANT